MERCLSLVLDEIGNISLTLERMEAKELDKYISKAFNSSDEIRKKYSKLIDSYLERHKAFITKVELYNDKRYTGSIVITELQNDLTIKKKKVLYKKDIIIFKEIIKNKKFIDALQMRDYINSQAALKNGGVYKRIFSEYYGKEIRFRTFSVSQYNRVMGRWKNAIKDSDRYYDIIRTVLKEYKNRYKELGLDSPDVVYSKYLAGLEVRYQSIVEEEKQSEHEFMLALKKGDKQALDLAKHDSDYLKEDKLRYKDSADEEDYPGDLEDLVRVRENISLENKFDDTLNTEYIFFDEEEGPVRYKSGADEEDYPGDLEKLDNSQVGTEEIEEEPINNKTKTMNNGHHRLFDF